MITYRKSRLIRVAEFHFDEDAPATRADIIRQLWRSTAVANIRFEESHTLVLDLTKSPEMLLANMHHNARYGVRRAETEHFQYQFWSPRAEDEVSQFCRFYDRFASSKHLVCANRSRLNALAGAGALDLSRVTDSAGIDLVWHAHYCTPNRARLIYSASLHREIADPSARALIGRANCYHTWHDILRFQRGGLAVYDLGGWYSGTEDQEKLGINKFKASFGGAIVREFNAESGATATGRLALAVKMMWLTSRGWSRAWRHFRRRYSQAANIH